MNDIRRSLGVAIFVTFVALAGCGGSTTGGGPPTPTVSPTVRPASPSPSLTPPTPTPTPTVALTQGIFARYLTTASSSADAITVGPDGNLWYTLAPNTIERSDTIGRMAAFTDSAAGAMPLPNGITSGSDGTLWFTERNAYAIGNVSTSGAIVKRFALGNTEGPDRIALGGDGNLYFTLDNTPSSTGIITQAGTYRDLSLAPNLVHDVVAASDGSLWYATSSGVLKLSTNGTFVVYPDPQGVGVDELCAAPDGSIWASSPSLTAPVGIYHISAAGAYTTVPVVGPTGGNSVYPVIGIACGVRNVYAVTNYMASIQPALGIFYEFDATGKLIQNQTDPGFDLPFAAPARMVEGPDGNLWYAYGNVLLKWVLH